MSENNTQGQTPPQPHAPSPEQMKKLAELGSLMICAPVAIPVVDPETGKRTELKASLIDILVQIAQGAPLASVAHPVRRSEVDEKTGQEREYIQNTSVIQLLAEIADGINDLCCAVCDGDDEEEDDDDEDDDDRIVRPAPRGGYKKRK